MKIIDLYAGAGGFTCGVSRVFPDAHHVAVEMWKVAADTWEANFGKGVIRGRVGSVIDELPTEADLVIGSPPCQGFSTMNQVHNEEYKRSDPRNQEWRQYLRVVERTRPRAFVMENVIRLSTSGIANQIYQEASRLGYNATGHLLVSADYGAPTMRRRFIIVGMRDGQVWAPPTPTHIDPTKASRDDLIPDSRPDWITVRDAFEDLPEPPTSEEGASDYLHVDRSKDADRARWAALPPEVEHPVLSWFQEHRPDLIPQHKRNNIKGKTFPNNYSYMEWDQPGPTITCDYPAPTAARSGHPSRTRQITLREMARIQSFPDSFQFTGKSSTISKQIGNAVPPILAEAIARSIKEGMSI